MNKREFRSINTGKLYKSTNEYWMKYCPVCQIKLLWNSYSDKEVSNYEEDQCISFDLKIQYCPVCDDYYVHII